MDSTVKLLWDKMNSLCSKWLKVGWIQYKKTVGFRGNKIEANKENTCVIVLDSWRKILKMVIHQHSYCRWSTWKERTSSTLGTFQFNTGKKLKCGISGLLIHYRHKKCSSSGRIASTMKEPPLLPEWMISQDRFIAKDTLISRVGFISFLGSCLRLLQVTDKATLHIYKTCRR